MWCVCHHPLSANHIHTCVVHRSLHSSYCPGLCVALLWLCSCFLCGKGLSENQLGLPEHSNPFKCSHGGHSSCSVGTRVPACFWHFHSQSASHLYHAFNDNMLHFSVLGYSDMCSTKLLSWWHCNSCHNTTQNHNYDNMTFHDVVVLDASWISIYYNACSVEWVDCSEWHPSAAV